MSENYAYYRSLMTDHRHRTQGVEFEGLDDSHFEAALRDPRTALLEIDGHQVPLATPTEYMPWLNTAYARERAPKQADPDFAVYYLNHFPQTFRADPASYIEAIRPIAEAVADGQGAIVADHSHSDILKYELDIPFIAGGLGYTVRDVLTRKKDFVRHYHYASPLISPDPTHEPATGYPGLWEGYQQALESGRETTDNPVKAHDVLGEEELEQVWAYYGPAFAELDVSDPVISGFDKEGLYDIFQDPRFIKVAHHSQTGIANMIIVARVNDCDWLNQAYYEQHYPDQLALGRVITSPGVIADTESLGLSLGTVGMMRKLIEYSGGDAVVTFACDEVSNQNVPDLAHNIFNRSSLRTDLRFPQNYQLFRQYHFASK